MRTRVLFPIVISAAMLVPLGAVVVPAGAVSSAGAVTGTDNSSAPIVRAKQKKMSAKKVLNKKLKVKNEQNAGYDRDLFPHWQTVGGCDTRARVLIAESLSPVTQSAGRCTVLTGTWWSAYDNQTITTAGSLDIDHYIPLAESWGSGASTWSTERRTLFANDTDYAPSLIAVSASSNRSKSDRDPAEWLPTNVAYQCDYAKTWITVKYRWRLSVDIAEKRALKRIVKTCSNKKVTLPVRVAK
jgi:hypothetical protein